MSKVPPFLLLLIIFFFIFPISFSDSAENATQTNETLNETLNETNSNETDDRDFFNFNPFKNFDFGNLIWLDDTNATEEFKKHEQLFVLFYSPWCHHCHSFMPIFVETSKYAEEKKLNVKFAKIDASASKNMSEEFNLQNIPSVFFLYKDQRLMYEGDRTKEALLKFYKRKLNDDIYKIETLSDIKEYANNSLVLLSTIKDKDTLLYKSFRNLSKEISYIEFLECQSDECAKEYKQDIVLFKKYDEKINKYTEEIGYIKDADTNSLKDFVANYGVETGALLTATEINMMFDYGRKMLFYFRNSSEEEQTKYDKMIKELGKELRNKKIYTSVVDITGNPLHENVARTFIVVQKDLPTLLFYDLRRNATYGDTASIYTIRNAVKGQLDKEYLKDYIDNVLSQKIRQDLYSEPPLDNYMIDGLKYIIGRTFDNEVIGNKNNVLLTLIDGTVDNPETNKVLDIMRNLTKKYTTEEKKIEFAYMDAAKNQPRNIELAQEIPPLVFLYTNAMSEKKMIKMNTNFTLVTEGEFEDFLFEKLEWGERPKTEKVEEKEEAKKKSEDGKKEEKKETDL